MRIYRYIIALVLVAMFGLVLNASAQDAGLFPNFFPGDVTPTATATATSTATATPTPTATVAPTATPTPFAACSPAINIHILNSSKKIMNGTATATTAKANVDAFVVDPTGFLVDAFTGSASAATGIPAETIQIVDNTNHVCNGVSDSAVAGAAQIMVRVCSAEFNVLGCPATISSTVVPYQTSTWIIDNNGFVDDNY